MNVLLTGAQGQLGRALQASAPGGMRIFALDRSQLDITDAGAVGQAVADTEPDWVFNAAAYTAVDKAQGDVAAAQAVNIDGAANLAEAVADRGGQLAQISTDFVFDGMRSSAYRPDDERHPLSVYGSTKSAGEDAAGPDALIVRTSWVYHAGHANFVTTMLRLLEEREELRVVADQIGAPTWAPGIAQVIWQLAKHGVKGVFHHSDAGTASWYDFAIAIQEEALEIGLIDRTIPIIPIASADYPTPAERPKFSLLDSSATRDLLNDGFVHWRTNLRIMLRQEKALG